MMVVYDKLLGEGTLVFRPAQANRIDENRVKLLPVADYGSRDEEWEFLPGSIVRCERRVMDGGKVLVAISKSN